MNKSFLRLAGRQQKVDRVSAPAYRSTYHSFAEAWYKFEKGKGNDLPVSYQPGKNFFLARNCPFMGTVFILFSI